MQSRIDSHLWWRNREKTQLRNVSSNRIHVKFDQVSRDRSYDTTIAVRHVSHGGSKSRPVRLILERWQTRPRIKRNAARVFTSATTVDARISRLPKRSNRFQSLNPPRRGVVALASRLDNADILLDKGEGEGGGGEGREEESIRNILALNQSHGDSATPTGNKTRNISPRILKHSPFYLHSLRE